VKFVVAPIASRRVFNGMMALVAAVLPVGDDRCAYSRQQVLLTGAGNARALRAKMSYWSTQAG
jgi:hypothetical protein